MQLFLLLPHRPSVLPHRHLKSLLLHVLHSLHFHLQPLAHTQVLPALRAGSMSVYSGPKEEQHRPRQLSRLRNEIFQESDDHTFHHDADRIQVPDSQGLVPETQYDQFTEFEHGVGPPNRGESEQPISLEDAAFLNRFKCVRRERTPINTKLFTFPFAQDDEPAGTDFSFVKVAQKGSSNQQQEKSIISIHGSSEQSMSATQTVIVSDNITTGKGPSTLTTSSLANVHLQRIFHRAIRQNYAPKIQI